MSDRFRATANSAGENAYDRLQPDAYAGAGDVADQVTPFQPDIDLEARTQGDAGQDRGGRSFAPTATNSQSLFTVVTDPRKSYGR